MKQLHKYAGINTCIVKPYPKGDDKGWPGWQFNLASSKGTDDWYEGATVDDLFGSKYLHEIYFKADPEYKGRYSVPVLWDKKLGTIVNNESLELLRDLQTAFNGLEGLPEELKEITLYPEGLREDIDRIGEWMQRDLNTGVYKGKPALHPAPKDTKFRLLINSVQPALLARKPTTKRISPPSSPPSTPSKRSLTATAALISLAPS